MLIVAEILNVVLMFWWLVLLVVCVLSMFFKIRKSSINWCVNKILGEGIIVFLVGLLIQTILGIVLLINGSSGLIFLLMPSACIVIIMGLIFENNPKYVGFFLSYTGIPLVVIGIIVATGYSLLAGCMLIKNLIV